MRILIVDDHRIVASGCRALFADDPEIVIVDASDAESGERAYREERPDICVLDINLPTVSGFELARRILERDASSRIIMFSMNDDAIFAARAIEIGAKGYVSKSGDPYDLVEAIREVGKGGTYLLAALTVAGTLFTWWARIHLGRFWSNAITRKEGHRVIDTGPYGLVRHPIYTGLIGAMLATGIAIGTITALLGTLLITFGLWRKARMEEGFLTTELGADAYGAYCRRVPMLIPFLPQG